MKLKVGDMIENKKAGTWNDLKGKVFIVSEIFEYLVVPTCKIAKLYSIQDMKYLELTIEYLEREINLDKTWEIYDY